MPNISYFLWIGTLQLIYMTYQDFKHNKLVDDRKNYFMYGIVLSLTSHVQIKLLYYAGLIFFFIFLSFILRKANVFGEADNNTLMWITTGLGILNPGILIFYLGIFFILTLFYQVVMIIITKINKQELRPMQFYPVLLISFISIGVIYRLF